MSVVRTVVLATGLLNALPARVVVQPGTQCIEAAWLEQRLAESATATPSASRVVEVSPAPHAVHLRLSTGTSRLEREVPVGNGPEACATVRRAVAVVIREWLTPVPVLEHTPQTRPGNEVPLEVDSTPDIQRTTRPPPAEPDAGTEEVGATPDVPQTPAPVPVPDAGAVSLAVLEPAPRVLRHWPPEDPSSDHALRRVSVSGGVATAAAPVSGSTAGAVASGIAAFDLSSRTGWGGGVELGFIQARRASSVIQALEVWASHQWLTLYGRKAWKPGQRLGIDATFGPRFTRVVYGKPETFDVRVGVAASVGLSTPLWWRLSATFRGTGVLSLDPTSAWPSVAEGSSPGTRVLLGNLTLGLALEW